MKLQLRCASGAAQVQGTGRTAACGHVAACGQVGAAAARRGMRLRLKLSVAQTGTERVTRRPAADHDQAECSAPRSAGPQSRRAGPASTRLMR